MPRPRLVGGIDARAAPDAYPVDFVVADAEPPELAVVVPVRDEAENILPLVGEIGAALEGRCSFEVIFVDDGSVDATSAQLQAARALHPFLRVVKHRRGSGQSRALISGVQAAKAPWIATLDGDGQNDPADIPALFARLHEIPADRRALVMLAGWRVSRNDSFVRRISSRIANKVRSTLLRDDIPDTGCGLKLFARATFLGLPRFDHMHRFLPALTIRAGGEVISVPISHRARLHGESKYGVRNRLWAGIVDMIGVMWLGRRAIRLDIEE